ncbi:MAG: FIG00816010: hypothetical protein [uncultured Blastococcus sp.]|uniref:Uncharacterized protein n=1 Tax=uncultured Blastococcus sp. TaxID=217144 RepID=A0A6J4J1V3_9ACTN|nr:MAG: FIG00816010: hypothetical protein [uncultured Blastococcus sp.]
MIAGAALLVLLGLGLFVGGVLTGETALYWGCVGACVVAAVLLLLARRKLGPSAPTSDAPASDAPAPDAPAAGSQRTAAAEPDAGPGAAPVTGAPAAGAAPLAQAPAPAGPDGAAAHAPRQELPDPPVEEVEVTDLLLVVDLRDEVLVIDEHPRYHVEGCRHVGGRATIPLPLDEARADGFTPCAVCAPDRTLAQRARDRKAASGS